MKFLNIALLFVIFALACSLTFAQDDATPNAKRIALRRPVGKAVKPTSTTTAAPPPGDEEEGDYHDENQENQYEDEEAAGASSTTTTTTEPPKKIGPVIRPFRSNDDFLNSLKRRQMNAKKHRAEKPTPKSRPAPAAEESDEAEESAPAPAPAPAKGYKAGNSALARRKLLKPGKPEPPADDAATAESEPQKEESSVKRPLSRLTLRKRN